MAIELQIFLWMLITSTVFVQLGRYSLEYHIIAHQATPERLTVLLNNLTFPTNVFYGSEPYRKLFLKLSQESLAENSTQAVSHKRIARRLFALIPAFLIGAIVHAIVRGVLEKSSLIYLASYSVWFLFACFSMYKAWNFGSSLQK
jgi:hypothetical protein